MVKIRLSRTGKKNYAMYRLVVSHNKEKRDSKFIEILGSYNPHTKESSIDKEGAEKWLKLGAQPTDRAKYLLVKNGVLKAEAPKRQFKGKPGKKATARASKKAE